MDWVQVDFKDLKQTDIVARKLANEERIDAVSEYSHQDRTLTEPRRSLFVTPARV